MAVNLIVPEVGESITEVEIGEWVKKEGDRVNQDDILVMIETDKVTVELPSPVSGQITKIIKAQGDTASVGDVIGEMEEGEGAAADAPAAPAAQQAAADSGPGEQRVMPAAQRAAAQQGVDVSTLKGSGPGGRVLKEDVTSGKAKSASPERAAKAPAPMGDRSEEIVPMTPLRRKVAERLVQAQQSAALLTTFNEVDMSAVMQLRAEHKDNFIKKYDIKLGFMSFFIKAVVDGLKLIPQINAEIRGTDIVYRNYYDIGVAVGGGRGLVVPIIRNAESLSFSEIEQTITDFGQRAKANKIKLEELQGGTFTISNGGVYGSLLSTPIINPPQSGILGLHGIKKRPVAVNGSVEVRPMMYLALTYDHRIVDGREAVTFVNRVKDCIENPARMLVEI